MEEVKVALQSIKPDEMFWRDHILASQASSQSHAEYCRQQGLPLTRFYDWRRKFGLTSGGRVKDKPTRPAFVEVKADATAIKTAKSSSSTTAVGKEDATKPIGHLLEPVPVQELCRSGQLPDPQWLARLIRELQSL